MFKKTTPNGLILVQDQTFKTRVVPANYRHYQEVVSPPPKMHELITVSVSQLTAMSNMHVTAICPQCRSERETPFSALETAGHSFCQPCRQRQAAYGQFIGQKVGRLLITGYADPAEIASGGDRTTFTAVCDCGGKTKVYAQSVKRAIRKGRELSCGCVSLEKAREIGLNNAGSNNGMYNPFLTDEERKRREKRRKIEKAKKWSRGVRGRDESCVICDGPNDVAHHLNGFVDNEDQRYKMSNGVALCETHHLDFHCGFMGGAHNPCKAEDTYRYLQEVHGWPDSRVAHLIKSKKLVT